MRSVTGDIHEPVKDSEGGKGANRPLSRHCSPRGLLHPSEFICTDTSRGAGTNPGYCVSALGMYRVA